MRGKRRAEAPESQTAPRSTTVRTLVGSPLAAFPLVALVFPALVCSFLFWARPKLESVVRDQVGAQLLVTRDASISAVTLWLETAEHTAKLAIADDTVAPLLRGCISEVVECDSHTLESRLHAYSSLAGFRHFIVADRQGRVRGADAARGYAKELPNELLLAAERVPGANVAVLPPVLDEGRPTLWVAAPVTAGAGDVPGSRLGELLLALPFESLDSMLHVAREGQSGETYAFDREGRFVSQSRFVSQLHRAGLLANASESAILAVEVRDPGVDLTQGLRAEVPRRQQPLTRMARDAVVGGAGVDVKGYRDYRGVPVVGAWRWLPEFGIGIATEVDVGEAFLASSTLRHIFSWLLGALALAVMTLLVAAVVVTRLRGRVRRAEILAATFGQYRIVRKLGEGGMGAVYLADHQLLRRPAVIKLVRQDRTSPDALSRFEREVQLTSTLAHPNTVAVYDYGRTEEGTPYYVMEYLEGIDLDRLVRKFGPLPQERVILLLRQLCGSLAEAHEARLVHRDVKPSNLIVGRRGGASDMLKVLDFGIAKSLAAKHVGLTESRVLLGTPEFMAPEMFESADRASPQTDLYAVGCVAFYLLTGTPVFDAASVQDLGMAHLTRTPESPSNRLGLPLDPDLESAVMACLAKRTDARPRSASALRTLLERSPLAFAWTEARAEAWWSDHSVEVAALLAMREELDRPPTLRRVRPARVSQFS